MTVRYVSNVKVDEKVYIRLSSIYLDTTGPVIVKFYMAQPSVQTAYTVVPTKSDSDEIFCLQLLSKTLQCTLHLS